MAHERKMILWEEKVEGLKKFIKVISKWKLEIKAEKQNNTKEILLSTF